MNKMYCITHLITSQCRCLWLQRCVAGMSSTGRTWVSSPRLLEGEFAAVLAERTGAADALLLLPLWNSGTVSRCLALTSLMVTCSKLMSVPLYPGRRPGRRRPCIGEKGLWRTLILFSVTSYPFLESAQSCHNFLYVIIR